MLNLQENLSVKNEKLRFHHYHCKNILKRESFRTNYRKMKNIRQFSKNNFLMKIYFFIYLVIVVPCPLSLYYLRITGYTQSVNER